MKVANIEFRNLGTVNQNEVIIEKEGGERVSLYFSYKTLVAINSDKIYCMKNYWSRTTGKLLNYVNQDKKSRISKEKFKKVLKDTFKDDDMDLLKDPVGSINDAKKVLCK